MWPRQTPLGEFNNNLAHSNNNDGLHVDRGPAADLRPQTASYRPRSNPADRGSAPVTAYFDNFVAYKHKNAAAWFRGDFTELRGAMLADNAIGVTFASNNSGMTNSVVVMYSANVGTSHNSSTYPDGQPKVRSDDFAIRGFEFYDGTVYVRNTHFEGFKPETYRQAGALSILNHTAFSLSPANWAEGLTFSANTNRVRFEERTYEQREASYREHDSGSDGFASGTFLDATGSVTGTAGAYVTVRNPLLDQAGCQVRSEWNAFICTPTNGLGYASLSLRDTSGSELSVGPVGIHRSAVGASPSHTMFGTPNGGIHVPNVHFRTTVALGYQYHYEFTGQAPDKLTVEMREVQEGNSLLVSVPYSGPLFIYRDYWIDSRSFRTESSALLKS